MKAIKLRTYPTELAATVEVRDFDLEDGRYARVVLQIKPNIAPGHFGMAAKAYEMDAAGNFLTVEGLGKPSGTETTQHTVLESSLGQTVNIDNGWTVQPIQFDPVNPGATVIAQGPPDYEADFGAQHWDDRPAGDGGQKLYEWREGLADSTARAKVEELVQLLTNSRKLLGLSFR